MVASRTTTIGNTVEQLWAKGQGNALIINTDIVHSLFVSLSNVISANDITIPPLGTMAVDGSANWYASTLTNQYGIATQIAPGVTSWNPSPAQVAAQISALGLARESTQQAGNTLIGTVNSTLGSPAQDGTVATVASNTTGAAKDSSLSTINGTLGSPAQDSIRTAIPNNISANNAASALYALTSQSIPITVTTNLVAANPVSLTGVGLSGVDISQYTSYELAFSSWTTTTDLLLKVILTFYNQITDTIPVDNITWWVPIASSSASPIRVSGHGPNRGRYMAVQVFIGSPAATMPVFNLAGSNRFYPRHDWRSDAGVTGFTASAATAWSNELCVTLNPTVAASGSINRNILLYAGPAFIHFDTQAGVGTLVLSLVDQLTQAVLLTEHPGEGNSFDIIFNLPRVGCTIQVSNTGASAATCNFSVIAGD